MPSVKVGAYADWIEYEFWIGLNEPGEEHLLYYLEEPWDFQRAVVSAALLEYHLLVDWNQHRITHKNPPVVEFRVEGEPVALRELRDWYERSGSDEGVSGVQV